MKLFTENDLEAHGSIAGAFRLQADKSDLIQSPTAWQKQGLQETASGYGRKLNSGLKINFEGKQFRIYVTIFSNVGSSWFKSKGRTIFVH